MSKILEDYGLLDENQKLTPRAIQIFFKHRREILEQGKVDLPYACYEGKKDELAAQVDIEDRSKYESFHENWIDGIYTDCAKLLNVEGNISLPFFDILALAGKLNLPQPNLKLPALLAALAIPPPLSIQTALCALNVDIAKLPDLMPKIMQLIKPPDIPIPKIPAIPSPTFPDLTYPVTQPIPGLTLKDRQIEIYTALPKALVALIGEVANPAFIMEFAAKGPSILFEKSCKALNEALPKPGTDNRSTYDANTGALVASLSKPLGAVALGLTVGSAKNGITGGFGAIDPDQVKEPEEEKQASNAVLPVPAPTLFSKKYGGFANNTTPEFRTKLVKICEELPALTGGRVKIKPAWLVAIMHSETFGTFLPYLRSGENVPGTLQKKIKKPNDPPAVGLIQFLSVGFINLNLGTHYTLKSIGDMTAVQQLDAVRDYFIAITKGDKGIKRVDTLWRAYGVVADASFLGKGEFIINTKTPAGKKYAGNPKIIDANGWIRKSLIMAAVTKPIEQSGGKQIYVDRQEETIGDNLALLEPKDDPSPAKK